MSFGFDASIITSPQKSDAPSINETLQTLASLATQRTQHADMLRRQDQEKALAGIYSANADTPANLSTALMRGGFGPQAFAAQDQASQMQSQEATRNKLVRDIQDAQRKKVGELFYGTKNNDDYQARLKQLAADPDPTVAMYAHMLPAQHDPAVTEYLGNLAVPAVERAKIAGRVGATQVITDSSGVDRVVDKRTGQAVAVTDESGNAVKAQPKVRAGGARAAGGGGADQIAQQTLDDWAAAYHNTGQFPAGLGVGKSAAALKIKVANRSGELFGSTDLGGAKAGYSADTSSLKALQKQADFTNSFEETGKKNLETFLEQAKKAGDTGSPLFNAPYRKFLTLVKGDPDMAGFEAARQTAVTEIAKVLQGSTGGGGLTEGAREEVKHLLSPDASLEQLTQAAQVLLKDMNNRKAAVDAQLRATRSRASGKPAAGEDGASAKSSAALNAGEVLMLDPKGIRHAVAEKDVADAEAHKWKRASP